MIKFEKLSYNGDDYMADKTKIKKVFIAGGTGFLGYYAALEFLKQGVEVSTISLPDVDLGGWFPKEIEVKHGNIFEMEKPAFLEMLKGFDALVYSIGPDDRVHAPKGEPAYEFFHKRLVDKVIPLFEAAREAGVKRAVLLNSYFAYFDREFPEKELAKNHPYIKVRVEQADALIKAGGGQANGGMDVISLELPYIFGSIPERTPLWKEVFLDRFASMPAVYFPKGGTVMIHVTGVAEAVVAAAFYGQHGDRLPIGQENHKYEYMINEMMKAAGAKKRYVGVPCWLATMGGYFVAWGLERKGQSSGLNYRRLMKDIQSKDFYIPEETIEKVKEHLHYRDLGFKGGNTVLSGIQETMRKCYPHRFDTDGHLKPEWNGKNLKKVEP